MTNKNTLEKGLKRKWRAKWALLKSLDNSISLAERSFNFDVAMLESAAKEMERRVEWKDKATDDITKSKHEIIYNKEKELKQFMNLVGFIDLNSIDVCVLMRKMIKDRDKWCRNLYARLGYTLMFELTEDVIQLLGCEKSKETNQYIGIRPLVQDINDLELLRELNATSKVWNVFWDNIGAGSRNYSKIRNLAAVHRDHDFKKLHQAIITISWEDAFRDMVAFNNNLAILREFIRQFSAKFFESYKQLISSQRFEDADLP